MWSGKGIGKFPSGSTVSPQPSPRLDPVRTAEHAKELVETAFHKAKESRSSKDVKDHEDSREDPK